jgi:uncharacterized membrane-anchored protein YitT (DUF2179 family)
MTANPHPSAIRHTPWEDLLALLVGCLLVALSLAFYKHSRLLTGGTTGLSFVVHYLSQWPLGLVLFAANLPFYIFAWLAMGPLFTLKTFGAVLGLSLMAEWMPQLLSFGALDPVYAATISGLLAGTGILILIRHGASLGGLGVLAIYLQKKKGWRAGTLQMASDVLILTLGLWVLPWDKVVLSVLSAMALNLVIAVNHRPDRYFGF